MKNARDIIEMERLFLGGLLIGADKGRPETRLQKDDFENKNHGKIYETILKQWGSKDKPTTPTLLTLQNELSPDIAEHIIAGLTNGASSANLPYYEDQIFEASKTRHFIKALQTAKEEIDKDTDTDTVIKNLIPALAEVTVARNEAGIKSAAELLNTEFPPVRWIVPGLISEGLTLISGAPKIGKSWLVLNLAIAAATGGFYLGRLAVTKTDTLYLALEDTERRIKNRLQRLNSPKSESLKITTQWRDGYIGLDNYLKTNREIGLVIIDTLARFANIEDMNDYSMTTAAMARLKRIADEQKIAILVIHHTRKGSADYDWTEAALGSQGLTGTTDSTIVIDRPRNKTAEDFSIVQATLYATGRDSADTKYNMTFDLDLGGWNIINLPPKNDNQPKKSKGNSVALGDRTPPTSGKKTTSEAIAEGRDVLG